MRTCHGFTLLELMVTLVVAAIVMTIGIPNFRDQIRDNRVTTQANELVNAINLARSEAVKRGRRVQVVVTAANGWSAAVSVVGADDDDRLRVVDRAGSAISLSEGATIVFLPTGTPIGTPPTFIIEPAGGCSRMQRRQVAIAPSGQITTTRLACA